MHGGKIDASAELRLNSPVGGKGDPKARIYPFKLHRGRQLYDNRHRYLINPQLAGQGGFDIKLD